MEEEMADEAGQEDGPAPPDEEVAACLTKTQFAACAKQWTRPAPRPLDPATDELTFQQSEVCRRRCPRRPHHHHHRPHLHRRHRHPNHHASHHASHHANHHHRHQHHPNHHGPQHLDPRPAFVAPSTVAPSSVATASTHTAHRRVPRPQVDYTIDSVIPELTGTFTQESRAAVIRMFGTTAEGNSVMVHVHGFFPYLYVRAPAGFTPAHCEAFRQTLAQRLKGQSQKEPLVNPVRARSPVHPPATLRAQPATLCPACKPARRRCSTCAWSRSSRSCTSSSATWATS